jgi:uncharacterized membrane protein YdjX (TVP38/TMEM64 family)
VPRPAEPITRSRIGNRARFVVLTAGIAALVVLALLLPLERLPAAADALGPAAPVIAVLTGATLLAALVPRTAISLACGALFGAFAGPAVALATALAGAIITFFAGRLLGREFLASRGWVRWQRLDAWLSRRGVLAIATVRFLPLGPYGLVGYVYGTTSVRLLPYLLGTLIGATPSAIWYALIGAAVVTR